MAGGAGPIDDGKTWQIIQPRDPSDWNREAIKKLLSTGDGSFLRGCVVGPLVVDREGLGIEWITMWIGAQDIINPNVKLLLREIVRTTFRPARVQRPRTIVGGLCGVECFLKVNNLLQLISAGGHSTLGMASG